MNKQSNHRPTTENPMKGFPKTRPIIGQSGVIGYCIRPRVLTPARARIADALGTAMTLTMFGASGSALYLTQQSDPYIWAAGLVGPLLLRTPLRRVWRQILKRRYKVLISANTVAVRRLWGWRRYDRTLPHRFQILPHDKARDEAESRDRRLQQAQRRGQTLTLPRYYAEGFHVVFQYVGHRRDLMTVLGKKEALAILDRLKACDERMNNAARPGDGPALSPETQWSPQPGGIPGDAKPDTYWRAA